MVDYNMRGKEPVICKKIRRNEFITSKLCNLFFFILKYNKIDYL